MAKRHKFAVPSHKVDAKKTYDEKNRFFEQFAQPQHAKINNGISSDRNLPC